MLKTIVVPTDSSKHAEKAIELASDLARQYQADLILLHVLREGQVPEALRHMIEVEHLAEESSTSEPRTASIPWEIAHLLENKEQNEAMREAYEALGNRILEQAEALAREKGVSQVRKVLEVGDPADRILECAEREKADAIVMGSRGLGELKGLLMGSVSHTVNQLCKCTCVTVK